VTVKSCGEGVDEEVEGRCSGLRWVCWREVEVVWGMDFFVVRRERGGYLGIVVGGLVPSAGVRYAPNEIQQFLLRNCPSAAAKYRHLWKPHPENTGRKVWGVQSRTGVHRSRYVPSIYSSSRRVRHHSNFDSSHTAKTIRTYCPTLPLAGNRSYV